LLSSEKLVFSLLPQSALQPVVWVSACSTVVKHSQQEAFTECCCQRHVKPPTWRRTRNLERSNFRHKRPPASEATLANPAAEGGTMGEKWPKVATSTSLLGSFTSRKATTWDRRLYFPSEGRRPEDFFARKIRLLRPGLNPRTWVPKASTLPVDHRSRSWSLVLSEKAVCIKSTQT
jgi:hypothetical protein